MLKNTVERAAILCQNGLVEPEDLAVDLMEQIDGAEVVAIQPESDSEAKIEAVVRGLCEDQINLPAFEKALVREALRQMDGNQVQAAKMLGISRMMLRSRIKRYDLG